MDSSFFLQFENQDLFNANNIDHPNPSLPLLLEHQFKINQLQQLQHLQNQIFQQQIALISGQSGPVLPDASLDTQFNGLPTPGSSTELRPQPSSDYVSPMTLHYMDPPHDPYHIDNISPQQSHYFPARGSTSAPANIAFASNPSHPISLQTDLDFDISPLTSPWLGAHQQPVVPRYPSTTNKRAASPTSDESFTKPASKKPSPAIRPTNPVTSLSTASKKPLRTKSTTSTPALRSRKDSTTGDTPSPVDISMPPPAPPPGPYQSVPSSSPSATSPYDILSPSSPNLLSHLTPVTPASMMNLGRLGLSSRLTSSSNFKPSSTQDSKNADTAASASAPASAAGTATRLKITTDNYHLNNNNNSSNTGATTTRSKATKRTSAVSPSQTFKAILPAGSKSSNSTAASGTGAAGGTGAGAGTGATATTSPTTTTAITIPQPMHMRKTSHKAAEQKRRDSLKTTFDDLRGLLPPIPLPSDENFPGIVGDDYPHNQHQQQHHLQHQQPQRILPGALPPRGPPKAGGEGPNKGVSKLQLLMCGNDYIRQLKGRVERRDEEIGRLRKEVGKLRVVVSRLRGVGSSNSNSSSSSGEKMNVMDLELDLELDLERDLDAVEGLGVGVGPGPGPGTGLGSGSGLGRGGSIVADDEAEEDMAD